MEEATRQIFQNIPPWQQTLFYIMAMGALATFAIGVLLRMRHWARGTTSWSVEFVELPRRIKHFFVYVFAQPRLRRESGMMHLLIFWGFFVLFVGTELIALEHDTPLSFFHGLFYLVFSLSMDAFGILMLIGIGIAVHRRYVVRPERIEGASYGVALLLLAILGVTGFLLEGFRMVLSGSYWFDWSPGGAAVATLIGVPGAERSTIAAWHRGTWWFHAVVTFGFIAMIPFSRMMHVITAPLNIFFVPLRPKGALPTPFRLEELESGTNRRVVAASPADLSWKRILSTDACTECGLCQDACPAWAADRPLSPKRIIVNLRNHLVSNGASAWQTPLEEVISPGETWSCTTCRACMEVCPVSIEHIDFLVDTRRALMMKSRVDPNMSATLNNLRRTGNTYGMRAEQRLVWAAGLPVSLKVERMEPGKDIEVLYWVGCAGAFDERSQRVSRAVVSLLKRAGVKYAVLGPEERCTGDPARRLGEEGLFQQLARQNVSTLDSHGVRKIITQCPHCFNTIKNEYPEFGGRYEVVHHSEYIRSLIAEGRLSLRDEAVAQTITYHDSCYLGRHNDVYEAPRESLAGIPGVELREMPRSRAKGFCCGAGGANFWFDIDRITEGKKINAIRYEEAVGTGAEVVATACPFCMTMFDDAASSKGEVGRVQIRDVAEIVNEATAG